MKILITIISLGLLFTSCKTNNKNTSDVEANVNIVNKSVMLKMDENLAKFISQLDEKRLAGEITFYINDSLTKTVIDSPIVEYLAIKEVIQVPNREFPGEFYDSVVLNLFDLNDFIVDFNGDFNGDECIKVNMFTAKYKLIVDGQDLGEFTAFVLNDQDAEKMDISTFVNEKAVIE